MLIQNPRLPPRQYIPTSFGIEIDLDIYFSTSSSMLTPNPMRLFNSANYVPVRGVVFKHPLTLLLRQRLALGWVGV
jgi:hypothetical protein